MDVFALIGSSGTGKSHHAMQIAKEYLIDYIIDDGILIHNGKRITGFSAKAESSMIAAVKCAIFLDDRRASEMKVALANEKPKKLLILGTSEHMIERIIDRLKLSPLKQKIFINEILTEDQIRIAKAMREDGKHVIPLPDIEIRKALPNLWVDPIVNLFKRKNKKHVDEKSIVRPKFSQLGQVTISEHVVVQLVQNVAINEFDFSDQIKVTVTLKSFGVSILCEMKVRYGIPIQYKIQSFQRSVVDEIESLTGLTVRSIDVRVLGVYKD